MQDINEVMRLNKALASFGICSRRKADELIEQGRIKINDNVAIKGTKINLSNDIVKLDNEIIVLNLKEKKYTYLLLNKPVHVVSTVFDPEGRNTVLDFIPANLKKLRLYPVGRLDYFSEGLLILTDDGQLTYKLTHPKWHLAKYYSLLIRGEISKEQIDIMQQGMVLAEGEKISGINVKIIKKYEEKTLLELVLYQGVNRQIRRMCRDLNLTILNLKRVAQGSIKLGSLLKGEIRYLTEKEITALYDSCKIN